MAWKNHMFKIVLKRSKQFKRELLKTNFFNRKNILLKVLPRIRDFYGKEDYEYESMLNEGK